MLFVFLYHIVYVGMYVHFYVTLYGLNGLKSVLQTSHTIIWPTRSQIKHTPHICTLHLCAPQCSVCSRRFLPFARPSGGSPWTPSGPLLKYYYVLRVFNSTICPVKAIRGQLQNILKNTINLIILQMCADFIKMFFKNRKARGIFRIKLCI